MSDKILSPEKKPEDGVDFNLRPRNLAEFIGQTSVKRNLKLAIDAARIRKEPLEHVLLYGPPGLGKTTLAHIIAREMNAQVKLTSGPLITKAGILANLLTNLHDGDVIFVDEIHRLPTAVEEVLYSCLEDGAMDVLVGQGEDSTSVRVPLPAFTLVGATTRSGMLTGALRDRFGLPMSLDFYEPSDLETIACRSARLLDLHMTKDGCSEIAARSRGTPRIANRLIRRVRDYACVNAKETIDAVVVSECMDQLGVDCLGLDSTDRRLLARISGGPAGLQMLSALLGEDEGTIETVVEPFMMRQGLIERTASGRQATPLAIEHLKKLGVIK